jgi:hypothetical protein
MTLACKGNGVAAAAAHHHLGKALQDEPMKPMMNARGTEPIESMIQLLSSFACKFNLRHFSWG